MKVLLFIFMASIGPGGSSPAVEHIEMSSMASCKSTVASLKEIPKPGRGYTEFTYGCLEVPQ